MPTNGSGIPHDILEVPDSWLFDGDGQEAFQDSGLAHKDLLISVIQQAYDALPEDNRQRFLTFGRDLNQRFGFQALRLVTLCSGTDGCVDSLKDRVGRSCVFTVLCYAVSCVW